MAVTAQDRLFAERLIARVQEGDVLELAQLLAEYREVVLSCALVRVERAFYVKERKR